MITIRKATINDASFIALVIAEALGDDIMERNSTSPCPHDEYRLHLLAGVARTDGTLYSWRNTFIAENETGVSVGALVAYPGDEYITMRKLTFSMLSELINFNVSQMDAETRAGEYYIDSIAVVPEFRNRGIGKDLLRIAISEAKRLQRPAILACAPENIGAKRIYESIGFTHQGDMFIFGHNYMRMVVR